MTIAATIFFMSSLPMFVSADTGSKSTIMPGKIWMSLLAEKLCEKIARTFSKLSLVANFACQGSESRRSVARCARTGARLAAQPFSKGCFRSPFQAHLGSQVVPG